MSCAVASTMGATWCPSRIRVCECKFDRHQTFIILRVMQYTRYEPDYRRDIEQQPDPALRDLLRGIDNDKKYKFARAIAGDEAIETGAVPLIKAGVPPELFKRILPNTVHHMELRDGVLTLFELNGLQQLFQTESAIMRDFNQFIMRQRSRPGYVGMPEQPHELHSRGKVARWLRDGHLLFASGSVYTARQQVTHQNNVIVLVRTKVHQGYDH